MSIEENLIEISVGGLIGFFGIWHGIFKVSLGNNRQKERVREQRIPKKGKPGVTRALGISNFEDKIVHKDIQQVLDAIYEPLFLGCSFGFRSGLGYHDAIRVLRAHLYSEPVSDVLDVDLANFFNTIDHELLIR
jgi:retron-type reverse transcriptase